MMKIDKTGLPQQVIDYIELTEAFESSYRLLKANVKKFSDGYTTLYKYVLLNGDNIIFLSVYWDAKCQEAHADEVVESLPMLKAMLNEVA